MNLQYDNYVFDVYHTLIKNHNDEHAAKTWNTWKRWLKANGVKTPIYYRFRADFFRMDEEFRVAAKATGEYDVPEIDVIDIYRILFKKYGNDVSEEFLVKASYEFRKASTRSNVLFPGVIEYLTELKKAGKKVYILSNAQHTYTDPEIKMYGLDKIVDDYLLSSDYKCMKPDKAFFECLINKHNLDPAKTVMIGDNEENDYNGGLNAGMNAIWLHGDNSGDYFYQKELGLIK